MSGDDVAHKVDERVVELRKALADIEAEVERNSATHREQAERLGRDMDAIQAEVSRLVRQVIEPRGD